MEAYHCSFSEAMSLTVPQVVMLNHAAYTTYENSDRRAKAKSDRDRKNAPSDGRPSEFDEDDPIIDDKGTRLSELSNEESDEDLFNYLRGFAGAFS